MKGLFTIRYPLVMWYYQLIVKRGQRHHYLVLVGIPDNFRALVATENVEKCSEDL
jgi:hypothetical protein